MSSTTKYRKNSKRFLSDTPCEYGSVCWEVSADPEDRYDLIDSNLRIADCGKSIDLGFSTRKEEHLDKRIQKLDTLIESLQEMREALTSKELKKVVKQKIKAKAAEKEAKK